MDDCNTTTIPGRLTVLKVAYWRLRRSTLFGLIVVASSVLIGGLAEISLADDKEVQIYRNYTPQQIANLDEKIRSSQVPIMYIFAARSGMATGSELMFAMQLNALMYPGLQDYGTAVKRFQADLSDKPTGVLTVWQIHQLEQRFEMQKLSRVSFPNSFTSIQTNDQALVEGTMMIIDDKIAWPINHIKVRCYKSDGYCTFDEIDLSVPDAKSWSQSYQVMRPSSEYYDISRWGQDSIDGHLGAKEGSCRTSDMNLNFKTKEFYFITRNAGGDCKILGTTLEKLAKPRIAQIVDGSKIISGEFERIQKAAYDVLSSDFRDRVDRLSSQANPGSH